MDITQGKLVIGLNINLDSKESKYVAAVYNAIIEGQGNRFLMLIMFLIAVAKFLKFLSEFWCYVVRSFECHGNRIEKVSFWLFFL